MFEYTHPRPHGVPHDTETNDELGYECGVVQCGYCASEYVMGFPADADVDTLDCPKCGLRADTPPPERETRWYVIPAPS